MSVRFEPVDDGVVIRLDREHRANALDRVTVAHLGAAIHDACATKAFVVLTGTGSSFCAGLDRNEVAALFPDRARALRNIWHFQRLVRAIRLSRIPIVTYADGAVVGGGCGLFWSGDRSLAGPRFQFRLAFARLGLGFDMGTSVLGAHRVGRAPLRRLYLRDPQLDAAGAAALGLTDNTGSVTCELATAIRTAAALASTGWHPRERRPRARVVTAGLLQETWRQSRLALDLKADDMRRAR